MLAQDILLTIIVSATPFVFAAIGEIVTERAGVLNLGLEGMMSMGAVIGFIVGYSFDSATLGILASMLAGMVTAALFGVLVLWLGANQVACGLALTILGLGLSDLIGSGFVGQRRDPIPTLAQSDLTQWPLIGPAISYLAGLPFVGPVLFNQNALVYLSFALVFAVWWFLWRTRAGLVLRAVGENHVSAHALGYKVLAIRFGAILFGGACSGLAGAYLSLADTPFWVSGMTAGRGWIALALVVFATWLPWRALGGAYLFGAIWIGQLHMQAFAADLPSWLIWPSQVWTALPYAATIVVLVVISLRRKSGGAAPASLGIPFLPDR